jgi:hypothetical protein
MDCKHGARHPSRYLPASQQKAHAARHKKILAAEARVGRRHRILAQHSFYSGARGVLKISAYMIEQGGREEMLRVIERYGRQINRIQGRSPRTRRH